MYVGILSPSEYPYSYPFEVDPTDCGPKFHGTEMYILFKMIKIVWYNQWKSFKITIAQKISDLNAYSCFVIKNESFKFGVLGLLVEVFKQLEQCISCRLSLKK